MNGVAAAVVSSALGGTAAALTRYVIGASDPVTLAAFRFGIGFLLIFPLALALRARWPQGRDWIGVALLGIAFFALFFFLYNIAMGYTSAARGSLALATLPLTTMLLAAFLGRESLSRRKFAGVLTAVSGVVIALWGGLADAPPGAWRGDLVMLGATVVMALYSIWSRPFMARSSMLGFLAAGMGFGALASVALSFFTEGYLLVEKLNSQQWLAILCLGVFGGAAAFYLWVYALERTTPTRVTNTMTVNPVSASLLAAVLVGEPLGLPLALGIVAVGAGIWLASSTPR
ncbi:MAG TPA: DMT family transporter [Burkholderiales bacterium]|nr:DMT family transporter [Burkholderiales bacterium]